MSQEQSDSPLGRWEDLLQRADGAIAWEADAWGVHFSYVSESAAKVLGCSPEDWKAEPGFFEHRTHPDDWSGVVAAMYRAASQHTVTKCEHRMLRSDGATLWAQTSLSPSDGPDGLTRLSGVTVDVTALRVQAEIVRRDESRFRHMVDCVRGCGLFMTAPGGAIDTWSAEAERIIGYALPDVATHGIENFFPRDAATDETIRHLVDSVHSERHAAYEGWLVRKNGTRFWGRLALAALTDACEAPAELAPCSGSIVDLTAVHQWNEDLRKRAEHLELLVQGVHGHGIWMTAPTGIIEDWNHGAQRLTGYRKHEIIGAPLSRLLPDDEVGSATAQRLIEEAGRTGNAEYEGWLVRSSGAKFWGRLFLGAAEDESDTLRGFATVLRDLTERMAREEALRANEEHFRLLVDSVQDYAIFMLSVDGHVASWNRGAQRLNGSRTHEVLGAHASRFFPEEEVAKCTPQRLIEKAATEGHATYEGWLVRRNKEQFWGMMHLDAIEDANGQLRGFSNVARDLTAQKRAEAAVRESEQSLRLLVESVQDYAVFMVSPERAVASWNAGAERLLGYGSEEILGAPISRLLPPEEVQLGTLDRLLEHATQEGRGEYEGWLVRKDGTRFWGNIAVSAVKDAEGKLRGFSNVARDLTERMRAERAQTFLAEAGQALAGSLEQRTTLEKVARLATRQLADCCIVTMKVDSDVRPAVVAHQDAEKQRVLESAIAALDSDAPLLRGIGEAMRTKESRLYRDLSEADWVGPDPSGERSRIMQELNARSCICVPMIARGDAFGAVAFLSSVPGRRYDERDLRLAEELARRAALAVENARLYEEAQRAIRTREEVLAVVSHDLRGPLGTILMGAQQHLKDRAQDGATVDMFARIARSAQRMTHMIADLLDFGSIEASRLTLEPRDCAASDLVRDAVEIYDPVAAEKGVRLEVHMAMQDVQVRCDPNRIVQVLANLVGNAIKFTPSGGVVTVTRRTAEDGRSVKFSVTDSGPGISAEDLPHIFDRYWQAQRRAHEGVGLGLAITRGLVEAHGGKVDVSSTPGEGSTFCFTLPVVTSSPL